MYPCIQYVIQQLHFFLLFQKYWKKEWTLDTRKTNTRSKWTFIILILQYNVKNAGQLALLKLARMTAWPYSEAARLWIRTSRNLLYLSISLKKKLKYRFFLAYDWSIVVTWLSNTFCYKSNNCYIENRIFLNHSFIFFLL